MQLSDEYRNNFFGRALRLKGSKQLFCLIKIWPKILSDLATLIYQPLGSRTMVNQKSSMELTTLANSSMPTGLVMKQLAPNL
jgi:hypothetical protein